ncbi:MAG: glycerol-3-phosphate acyltransferase [Clostridia bacterium]|nr:glycerol-3-phosphate acyltransferase [Clostridia bacterium]MBR5044376.1 glycerol-3-phosphate acyltransferase [Clostridia bacterium]
MTVLIYVLTAVVSYLVAAVNPAIVLSHLVYHRDIRKEGSGNPGFTNFHRVYGGKLSWLVFILDIGKCVAVSLVAGLVFAPAYFTTRQLGAAYAGVFALIGHTYPVFYRFKGGKGFLVTFALLWVLDWRAGLVATAVMLTVLPLSGFMSLSSILTLIAGGVTLCITHTPLPALFLTFGAILLVIWRHRGNVARLIAGTEKKFSFRKRKTAPVEPTPAEEEKQEVSVGEEKE